MRPENEILLTCARLRLTDEHAARIAALLDRCEDWAYLERAARRHGLLPLLYTHLKLFSERRALPKNFLTDLHKHFQQNAKHSLFLTGELLKLLRLCESHGVPCLAFKGPLQAVLLYGNVALREFVDLDILVRAVDVPKVAELLAKHSYLPQFPLAPAQDAYYLRTHCERNFARSDGRAFVDLHWAITDDQFHFALKTEHLLRRLETAALCGATVKTVGPEDHLLILSVHAAKDLFSRLESLCAVAELLRAHPKLDWSRVLRLAGETLSRRRVFLALALAHELLEAPLPAEIFERVRRERSFTPLIREVRRQLFHERRADIGALERSRWNLRVLDRPRDALSGIGKSIFRPNLPEWAALNLPSSFFFLYYLVRPVRLAGKYLRQSVRRDV
jgi:hypothetical protein